MGVARLPRRLPALLDCGHGVVHAARQVGHCQHSSAGRLSAVVAFVTFRAVRVDLSFLSECVSA